LLGRKKKSSSLQPLPCKFLEGSAGNDLHKGSEWYSFHPLPYTQNIKMPRGLESIWLPWRQKQWAKDGQVEMQTENEQLWHHLWTYSSLDFILHEKNKTSIVFRPLVGFSSICGWTYILTDASTCPWPATIRLRSIDS
jgi:hypothetical protein